MKITSADLLPRDTIIKAMSLAVIELTNALLRGGQRHFHITSGEFLGIGESRDFLYHIVYQDHDSHTGETDAVIYIRAEQTIVTKTFYFVAEF